MGKRLSYEAVKHYIEVESDSGCKLLSEKYINSKTKLKIKCACGECYETTYDTFKNRKLYECNKCRKKVSWNYELVKEFVEVESKSGCLLLSQNYNRIDDKYKIRCKCGDIFETSFSHFYHNNVRQCNKCGYMNGGIKHKKTHEEFIIEVKDKYGDEYSIVDEYKNANKKIFVIHNKCGYEWGITPNNLLRGYGCPKCAGNMKKTTEEFKKEVYDLAGDEYEVISEYINDRTKLKIKHNTCGYIYKTTPNDFLNGGRCPKCSSSKGEIVILDYLLNNNITNIIKQHTFEDCKNIKPLYFDFYLPKYNLIIEYDGIQHFEPVEFFGGKERFKQQQQIDKTKNKYCEKNNISLLRIPYWDFDNINQILGEWLNKHGLIEDKIKEQAI